MTDVPPEAGVNAAATDLPPDPARFPFVRAVEAALGDRGVPLVRVSGPDAHRPAVYRVDSPGSEWECLVEVDEDRECVAVRSILPIEIPPERRHEVAILVAGVNSSRIIGHFALEPRGTRVTHTSGLRLAGLVPSPEALHWMLGENLLAVDLHMAAFMLVAWAEVDPDVALRFSGPVACEAA